MQTREKTGKGQTASRQLWTLLHKYGGIGHFLLAFVLADACLMGSIRPFGLCYGLTLPEKDRLWGVGGAFLGGLMIGGTAGGLVYGAIGIVALTADTFLLRESEARELLLPLLLAGVVAIVKLPFALIEGIGAIALLCLEGALAALGCYALLLTGQESLRRGTLGVMIIAAFADLQIMGLISPAGAAAIIMTMIITYGTASGQEGHGLPDLSGGAAGLVIGAFLDMARSGGPFYAAVFGLTAVLAAFLPGKGKISFAISFLLSGLCCLIWGFSEPRAMGCMYDLFLAASVFLLLPEQMTVMAVAGRETSAARTRTGLANGAALRLWDLGRALTALAHSAVDPVEGEESVSVIFDRAASAVCRSCDMARECWIEDYVSTVDGLNDLMEGLRRQGHISPGDLTGVLAVRCSKKGELCAAVNREYMSYLRRRAAVREKQAQSTLLQEQYAGIGTVVDRLAVAARGDYVHKPLAEKQIAAILGVYRRGLRTEVWQKNGRLHISVGPFEMGEQWVDEEAFVRSAELAMGCRFLPPEAVCEKAGELRLYKEREALAITLSGAVRKKPGEEVCGDAYSFFHTEDGRAVLLLSDGMGTGREAARLARSAIELIAAFVRSGCSIRESAGAVIPFLRARGARGFATLDLLEVDLFTGVVQLIKCGAADSWLVENGQVQVLSLPSLPPGVDPGSSEVPKGIDLIVRAGCRIIMTSDGAELKDPDLLKKPGLTAGEIIRTHGGESQDDLTVLVLSVTDADNGSGIGQTEKK